jgi:hypothetical protein
VITKARFTGKAPAIDALLKFSPAVKQRQKLQLQQKWRPRHNSRMSIFPPDPLTPDELTALKVVAVAPPLRGLPYRIQRRLLDLGFVQTVRGGLVVTEDGLLCIQLSMNGLRD